MDEIKFLGLETEDVPLTCLVPQRSSRVLECLVLVLILLFFLRGSLTPSSSKDGGILTGTLGVCSLSESGRNSGSLSDIVGGVVGLFMGNSGLAGFLCVVLVVPCRITMGLRWGEVGDLVACSSSTSSDMEGDDSLALDGSSLVVISFKKQLQEIGVTYHVGTPKLVEMGVASIKWSIPKLSTRVKA